MFVSKAPTMDTRTSKQCQNMTKQCFVNVNYIYNPIEKQRVSAFMVISGYLSKFHIIFV